MRAMLAYLEKMTLEPHRLGFEDAQNVRAAGCSDEEIHEAIYVAYLFNIYDRLADSMGWIKRDEERYRESAKFLLKSGYQPGAIPPGSPHDMRRQSEKNVLEAPGKTSSVLRRAVFENKDVPPVLAKVVAKTHEHAYKVTDEEIAELNEQFEDDALFELLIVAATGAASRRADAAFAALDQRPRARTVPPRPEARRESSIR